MRTPRITTPRKRAQSSGSSMRMDASPSTTSSGPSCHGSAGSTLPGISGRTVRPSPSAASSRAIPRWLSRSPRFDVISTSIVVSSSPRARTNDSPGVKSPWISRIPEWSVPRPSSRGEQSIPSENSPRIFAFLSLKSPGSVAPTGAKGYHAPAFTFGAPHTTWTTPAPASTVHRERRSALGCGPAVTTRPTTTSPSASPGEIISSTGAPRSARWSATSRGVSASPGTMSLSQRYETFIGRTGRGSGRRSRRRSAGRPRRA